MAKDPAFLFYSNDFLAGTFTMSDAQVGKYIRLLCLQHQKGELTKKDMLNICKTYDKDVFNKFICQDGVYYNLRLKEEAEKRKAYSDSRRNNRKVSKTYVKHMENENEDVNINEDNNINIPFSDFWNLYDKKRGDKAKLEAKWNKLTDTERQEIMDYIPKYKLSQPDKQFRKDPQTFLNNKSWNDELIGTTQSKNGNNTNGLRVEQTYGTKTKIV